MTSTNYRDAFALFDERGTGLIPLHKLGDLLRSCGQNPTQQEIEVLEKSTGHDFTYEEFSKLLNRPNGFEDPGPPERYYKGFQVFDKSGDSGKIGVGQLRYILTNLGERFTDEEVDELLKAVDTTNGELNYMDLVAMVLAN